MYRYRVHHLPQPERLVHVVGRRLHCEESSDHSAARSALLPQKLYEDDEKVVLKLVRSCTSRGINTTSALLTIGAGRH